MLPIYYSDIFAIALPEGHPFPNDKYALLRGRIGAHWADRVRMEVPTPASDEDILRAHSSEYLQRFVSGDLSPREIRRVGLPWSKPIVKRTRYAVGATIAACRAALARGVAVNLGGGTHHAFPDHGQGFCWLNDRDRQVIGRFTRAGLPVAITMAGGYAPDVQDIVDIHFGTIEAAIEAISP